MREINYNEIVGILNKSGDLLTGPGVVKPGANIDVVRRGVPVLSQRVVIGDDGSRMVVRQTQTVDLSESELSVEYTPPRSGT